MKNEKANYILSAVLMVVLLISCGSAGLSAPEKPTALEPDPENPDRIEIYWKAVEGADIYYVYRSTTENGTYALEGFTVTSTEVDLGEDEKELRYSFVDAFEPGEGGSYWYRVTAAANSDITASGESDMSPAVEALTYNGTWSTAKALGSAAQLKLIADNTNLWAVYSLGSGTDAISVQKYAADESSTEDPPPKIWRSIASPGNTAGDVNGPYSVFINGGELYTVFRDASNFVSMMNYHNWGTSDTPSYAWEQVGAAKFNTDSTGDVTEVSAVTTGFGTVDIYSAFLEGAAAQLYENNDEIDLSITSPVDVRIVNYNNTLFYGYESESKYYLRELNTTLETLEPEAGTEVVSSAVDDGNIVFVSGGGSLYAIYIIDGGGLEIKKLTDGSWSALADIVGDTPPSVIDADKYGTLDSHWFNNRLYVFYLNAGDSNKGWVKYYDETDGWQNAQRIGGSAVTGGGTVSRVQLASAGNILYAGYIEDSEAYVKILE